MPVRNRRRPVLARMHSTSSDRIGDVAAGDAEIDLLGTHQCDHAARDHVLRSNDTPGCAPKFPDQVGQQAGRERRQARDAAPCRAAPSRARGHRASTGSMSCSVRCRPAASSRPIRVNATLRLLRSNSRTPPSPPACGSAPSAPAATDAAARRPREAARAAPRRRTRALAEIQIHKSALLLRSNQFNCLKCAISRAQDLTALMTAGSVSPAAKIHAGDKAHAATAGPRHHRRAAGGRS